MCARARAVVYVCHLPLSFDGRSLVGGRAGAVRSFVSFAERAKLVELHAIVSRVCTNGEIITGVLSLTRYSVRKTSLERHRARCECNTRRDARSR